MNQRAITYRRLNAIPADWGTAVNVQAMVFGNMGENVGDRRRLHRNPSTGDNALYGEFLASAQGEDVVADIRTPQNITEAARKAANSDHPSLESLMPEVFSQFVATSHLLEKHYRDMQDLEFTVERGKLWMLQTRNGKRTAKAALRCAVEMANEGLISRDDAVSRIEPGALDQLLHPNLDPKAKPAALATGLPASPGAASGEIVFSADEAQSFRQAGRKSILVRVETSPEDIHGMHAAEGVVSDARRVHLACGGGRARDGQALRFRRRRDPHRLQPSDDERGRGDACKKGDILTIDGGSGEVMQGAAAMVKPEDDRRFRDADDLGRSGQANEECAPTPRPRRTPASPVRSRRAASASAAPSTCSSTASESSRCVR